MHSKSSTDHNDKMTVTLHLALPNRVEYALRNRLRTVSNPNHKQYGRYMTHAHLRELIFINDNTVRDVIDWIKSVGVSEANVAVSPTCDSIQMHNVDVRLVARLLYGGDTTMLRKFVHFDRPGYTIIRACKPPELPDFMSGLIGYVHGVVNFPPVRPRQITAVATVTATATSSHQYHQRKLQHAQSNLNNGIPKKVLVVGGDETLTLYVYPSCIGQNNNGSTSTSSGTASSSRRPCEHTGVEITAFHVTASTPPRHPVSIHVESTLPVSGPAVSCRLSLSGPLCVVAVETCGCT